MRDEQIDSTKRTLSFDQGNLRESLRTITMWLAAVVVLVWILRNNSHFIFLLILSWLVAIAMDPAIRSLVKRGLKRGAATGIVMLGLVVLTGLFIALFGSVFFAQAADLVTSIPNIVANQVNWLNSTFHLTLDPTKVIDQLNVSPSQLAGWASNFAGGVVGITSAIVGGLFQIMTLFLFAFYFAAEGPKARRLIGSWLSPSAQEVFVTSWDITIEKTGGFVVSKLLLAALSGTAHSIFFAVIGLPYWLPMGIITGITSQFIPTVGTYIGIMIPVFVAAFDQPSDVVLIIVFATVYQQVENYLLSPRISRMTMDIHPAIAFGSVIVFANLFGAIGALMAIPLAAAIISVIDTYGRRYELIPELESLEGNSKN
jgi:predicted PurR-regulated permease PerM